MSLTASDRRILTHLRDHPGSPSDPGLPAGAVARVIWADSPGWGRMTKGWNGFPGKAMPAKMGRLLNALEKRGLVYIRFRQDDGWLHKDGRPRTRVHHYVITDAGKAALDAE